MFFLNEVLDKCLTVEQILPKILKQSSTVLTILRYKIYLKTLARRPYSLIERNFSNYPILAKQE